MKVNSKILFGFGGASLLITLASLLSFSVMKQSEDSAALQGQAYLALRTVEGLWSGLKDAETAQRGFLQTEDEAYRELYLAVHNSFAPQLAELRRLARGNRDQWHRLDVLTPLIEQRLVLLQQTTELYRSQHTEEALQILRSGRGERLMDEIRVVVNDFIKLEENLLQQRTRQFNANLRQLLILIPVISVMVVILAALSVYLVYRETRRRAGVWEQENQILDQRVLERTEELKLERDKLAALFDNAPIGLLIANAQGGEISMNVAAQKLLRFNFAEDIHRRVEEYVGEWNLYEAGGHLVAYDEWPLVRAIRGDYVTNQELYFHHVSSGYQWIGSLTSVPIRNSAGDVILILLILFDITERKQAESEILKLNAALEQRVAERTNELEKTLSALRTSEERYRLLVDGIKDIANIMLDIDGRIISWNQGAERLNGYIAEEIIGRHFSIFYPPDGIAAGKPDDNLMQALKHGHTAVEGWHVRKDGSRFWASFIITALYNDKGEVQGFSKITRDITQRKQYEQQLILAKEAAELANRTKVSFLATMSHEIRTPLTGILGMLEILLLMPLDREQTETLKAVWDSSSNLLRIVNDILDWSKIEEGKLELSPQSTSIPQLLQEVVNTYSRVASSKSLVLWQHADARLSPMHIVDPLRLSQILNNFVSNALKFTRRGEIELRAELLEQLESGERIRFSVKDTGIGIAKDVQPQLFQRYQQASGETTRLYGGTGLGLSICQHLADLMDGQIELSSEPEAGSTFSLTLTLPVSTTPEKMVQAQYPEVERRKVKPLFDGSRDVPLVLAVDDHPINRNLLVRQLRLLGLHAEKAENGQAALSMWRKSRFALIITDCHMPEMDGYALTEAIRRIEAEENRPRTPIIAWTANALGNERDRCFTAGMDDLLVKPASLVQLKKTLEGWLSITQADSRRHASLSHERENEQSADPIDYAELSDIALDSKERMQLLHDLQAHVRADYAILLEMLEQDDRINAQQVAHRMKGACRMAGAKDIANACAAIEQAARDGNMEGARIARTRLDDVIKQFEIYLAGARKNEEGTDQSS